MLELDPEIRTSGKKCFYLFHRRHPDRKLWRAFPFHTEVTSLLREWDPSDWEQGVQLRDGARDVFPLSLDWVTLPIPHWKVYFPPLLFEH